MASIKEAELPGLGKKFEVTLDNKETITVIIHDEGTREIYHCLKDEEDPCAVFTMSDQEARQLGSIIGGAFYQPKMLERLEAAVSDLHIEWIEVQEGAEIAGKSIGELGLRKEHSINIIAAIEGKKIRKGNTRINPGPGYIFTPGHIVVAAGTIENMERFEEMLGHTSQKRKEEEE